MDLMFLIHKILLNCHTFEPEVIFDNFEVNGAAEKDISSIEI